MMLMILCWVGPSLLLAMGILLGLSVADDPYDTDTQAEVLHALKLRHSGRDQEA